MFRKWLTFHHESLSERSPTPGCQLKAKELSGMYGTRKALNNFDIRIGIEIEVPAIDLNVNL
jgi:hypothetical protein